MLLGFPFPSTFFMRMCWTPKSLEWMFESLVRVSGRIPFDSYANVVFGTRRAICMIKISGLILAGTLVEE